ncbi:DUF2798 domain-containing protein [Panacagrimonas sp.]|uniref:DUF2798 domain-containing protein n=1 Tax=Panacagrimonas sp. TaxID=2480088 RepID=UPI003B51EBB3
MTDGPRGRVPARWGPHLFGTIQSGLTTLIATGIASIPAWGHGTFFRAWISAWLLAWCAMLPIVLLAAPLIRRAVDRLTSAT